MKRSLKSGEKVLTGKGPHTVWERLARSSQDAGTYALLHMEAIGRESLFAVSASQVRIYSAPVDWTKAADNDRIPSVQDVKNYGGGGQGSDDYWQVDADEAGNRWLRPKDEGLFGYIRIGQGSEETHIGGSSVVIEPSAVTQVRSKYFTSQADPIDWEAEDNGYYVVTADDLRNFIIHDYAPVVKTDGSSVLGDGSLTAPIKVGKLNIDSTLRYTQANTLGVADVSYLKQVYTTDKFSGSGTASDPLDIVQGSAMTKVVHDSNFTGDGINSSPLTLTYPSPFYWDSTTRAVMTRSDIQITRIELDSAKTNIYGRTQGITLNAPGSVVTLDASEIRTHGTEIIDWGSDIHDVNLPTVADVKYFITGGAGRVFTDATLTGNGHAESPLRVVDQGYMKKVVTDATLTGDGVYTPLSVVGGGGGGAGTVFTDNNTLMGTGDHSDAVRLKRIYCDEDTIEGFGINENAVRIKKVYTDGDTVLGTGRKADEKIRLGRVVHDQTLKGSGTTADPMGIAQSFWTQTDAQTFENSNTEGSIHLHTDMKIHLKGTSAVELEGNVIKGLNTAQIDWADPLQQSNIPTVADIKRYIDSLTR